MSYIAHPLPDPPPLRALRALQGGGNSAQQFKFVWITGILNRFLRIMIPYLWMVRVSL